MRVLPFALAAMQPALQHGLPVPCLASGPEKPPLSSTCQGRALKHTHLKMTVAMCGSCGWLVVQQSAERASNRIASLATARHQSRPSELCTASWCSQDLDAFQLPCLWTQPARIARWCSSFVPKPCPAGAEFLPLATSPLQACHELLSPYPSHLPPHWLPPPPIPPPPAFSLIPSSPLHSATFSRTSRFSFTCSLLCDYELA